MREQEEHEILCEREGAGKNDRKMPQLVPPPLVVVVVVLLQLHFRFYSRESDVGRVKRMREQEDLQTRPCRARTTRVATAHFKHRSLLL